jgi:hypothetical protein
MRRDCGEVTRLADLGVIRCEECGIISDEAHLIGRAKEKYEGM